MRYVCKAGIALTALAVSGCVSSALEGASTRGKLAYASTDTSGAAFHRLSAERVSGKACFSSAYLGAGDPIFERAVADALKSTPEATALLDVELRDSGACFVISGIPARAP